MSILLLWRYYRVALRTFAIGLGITVGLQIWLNIQHKHYAQTQLNQLALSYAERVQYQLEEENHILQGLQSAFIANTNLTNQAFTQILKQQNIQGHFPNFVSIQFIREIQSINLESYTRSRQLENPSFTVKTTSPRPVYQIIDFLYPDGPNTHVQIGLDISDQTLNLIAIEYSRDQGRAVTSAIAPLKNAEKSPLGFIINLPIYMPNKGATNQIERRAAFIGSINAILSIENIINWLGKDLNKNVRIQLQDTGSTSGLIEAKKISIFYPKPGQLQPQAFNELSAHALIQFPGRQWSVRLFAHQSAFPQQNIFKYLIWVLGLILSTAFAVLLQRQRNSHESALDLAEQITQDLRKHEQHFQQMAQLAEQSRDLIISRDLQGNIVYANQAARIYFSDHSPILLGQNKPLLLSAELAINSIPIRQECQHRNADGELHYFELTLFPLYNQEGLHEGSAMFAHDISQHKELLVELQNSRERFTSLLELATDWYWEQDTHFRFTQISAGFFKTHPIDRSLLLGRCRWEMGDDQLSTENWRAHKAQLDAQQNFYNFIYTLNVNEHRIIICSSGQAYFNEKNEFLGYRGISKEIASNNEHAALQEQIASILNSMADGVIAVALNGEVEYMNPAAIHLLNCRTTAVLGKHIDRIYRVISLEEHSPLVSLIHLTLSAIETSPPPREVLLLSTHRQSMPIKESVIHLKNSKGTLVGLALIFRHLKT
ncbi:CHASE domain-containing protein [Iodobacter sp.]|uniref:CHASE domain-containing protein n=1 Tax=Iodobacter sp. TaxID=1915058 RepID=UPI0025D96803|nr:CHASE domain-containing protein [Iodobacter sp.]